MPNNSQGANGTTPLKVDATSATKTPTTPKPELTRTISFDNAIMEALHVPPGGPAATNGKKYNPRQYWPDVINTPANTWTFSCGDIINKLDDNDQKAAEEKKNMEKCLMYFYTMKKKLNLFDHTYTAASILFYRFWFQYGLPGSLLNCIHVAQAILVTACKTMENNRPIDSYVKETCEFINKVVYGQNNASNIDKLKWEVRDKLVTNEKRILSHFGFDINIENPKELVEDIFSGFYRYNRDYTLPEEFRTILPKLLQEVRSFIVLAVTQPVSLLCDGYSFLVLSMLYCGIQYKEHVKNDFKFPKNFFKERFPIKVTAEKFEAYFTDYRLLEQSFFDLKSNKGDKLLISRQDIESIIEEDDDSEPIADPYSYESLKDGEIRTELMDHIEQRVEEYITRMSSGKTPSRGNAVAHSQPVSSSTSPSRTNEHKDKKQKI